jgi:hypothetical protein
MPRLSSKKHERFAQELAIGCSQSEAGRRAGFVSATSNKSYLSKLAQRVAPRVEEIRRDNVAAAFSGGDMTPNPSGKPLSELFPVSWIVTQYQTIQKHALGSGDMRAATDAVKSLQRMVEAELAQAEGSAQKVSGPVQSISVGNAMKMLDKMGGIAVVRQELPVSVPREVLNRAHRAACRDE